MTKEIKRIVVFYDDGTYTETEVSKPTVLPPVFTPSPAPSYGPIFPAPNWQWPHVAPGTVTCKMADGTEKEIQLTSPIVAQNT